MIRRIVRAFAIGMIGLFGLLALWARTVAAHGGPAINIHVLESGSIAYKVSGDTGAATAPGRPAQGQPSIPASAPRVTATPATTPPTTTPPTTISTALPRSQPVQGVSVVNPPAACQLQILGSGGNPQVAYFGNGGGVCPSVTPTPANLIAGAGPNNPRPKTSVSPAAVAATFWQDQGVNYLPSPKPYIAPGKALAGLPGYLEVRAPLSTTFSDATQLGTLTIAATAVVYVDWGDGTGTTGPYHNAGAPWPNGTITHYWDYDGTYKITVSQDWSASWTLAGQSGTLGGLQTYGSIDNFRVGQLESVRNY